MKTVIIKWKQQYTDLLIERVIKNFQAFRFHIDTSLHITLDLPEPINEELQFKIVNDGKVQASGRMTNIRLIKTEDQVYTHRVFLYFHHFNYQNRPYLSVDELAETMPTYNWKGDKDFVMSEEDSEILDDIWYIGANHDFCPNTPQNIPFRRAR